jgi:hypothetical protein
MEVCSVSTNRHRPYPEQFRAVIRPGFGGGGLSRNRVVGDVQELSVVGLLVLNGWDVSDG